MHLTPILLTLGLLLQNRYTPGDRTKTYLKASHSSTLTLANIDEGYVASLIDCLKNKESSGIDKLSNKHIKAAKNVIAKPQ